MKKYFLVAGEPSGDIHGGNLIKALKKLDPNSSFMGHGGNFMKDQGMQIVEHVENLSIMGFTEVIRHLPRMINIMDKTIHIIKRSKPDRIILIDFPGFNLRLAKKLHFLKVPITYFILPQAWAWKNKRVQLLKKYIDQSISIFPFERDWYEESGLNVEFFGHPFVEIEHFNETTKEFFKRHSLDINKPVLTLLPGSRQQEVDKHWPVYVETVKILRSKNKDIQVLVGKHSNVKLGNYPDDFRIETVAKKAMIVGTAGLVSSGTATLECAIENLPIVVCYKLFPITWFLLNFLVKVKYSSIVNLIMDQDIVPELLQKKMQPSLVAKELNNLLDLKSDKRKKMISKYAILRSKLGEPGAYIRISESILKRTRSIK